MSIQHTRKSFFAKFFGMLAVAGFAPSLFSKSAATPVSASTEVSAQVPFSIRPDARSVARSGDVI